MPHNDNIKGDEMTIGSKEHYEIMSDFERDFKHLRLDREEKSNWTHGCIYQDGMANNLFRAYSLGYASGRLNYIQ